MAEKLNNIDPTLPANLGEELSEAQLEKLAGGVDSYRGSSFLPLFDLCGPPPQRTCRKAGGDPN